MRAIFEVAHDIRDMWPNVHFSAKPYLRAMFALSTKDDMFYEDDAKSIVLYFLANASTFKGERARQLKQELKDIIK